MTRSISLLTPLVAATVLSACAGSTAIGPRSPTSAETIAVSVGPCFGFCPVYTLSVTPAGSVTFDGDRHTAGLGRKMREAGPGAYTETVKALAPYRPQTATSAETACEVRISDQQHYDIRWTAPNGTVTTLKHDRGCRSTRNDDLNAVLERLPAGLGIEQWAKPLTRPGAPRG